MSNQKFVCRGFGVVLKLAAQSAFSTAYKRFNRKSPPFPIRSQLKLQLPLESTQLPNYTSVHELLKTADIRNNNSNTVIINIVLFQLINVVFHVLILVFIVQINVSNCIKCCFFFLHLTIQVALYWRGFTSSLRHLRGDSGGKNNNIVLTGRSATLHTDNKIAAHSNHFYLARHPADVHKLTNSIQPSCFPYKSLNPR